MKIVVTLVLIFVIGFISFASFMNKKIGKHSIQYVDESIMVFIVNGYQADKGNRIFKNKLNQFYFDSNKDKLYFNHMYWNGVDRVTMELRPARQVTKSKNVVGRALVGGAVAGIGGAAIGGLTSKKVTTNQDALTQSSDKPKNVFLVFTKINNNEQVTSEINIDGIYDHTAKKISRLEQFLGKKYESY